MGYMAMNSYDSTMGMDMAGGYMGAEQSKLDVKMIGTIGGGIVLGIVLGIIFGRRNVKKKQI